MSVQSYCCVVLSLRGLVFLPFTDRRGQAEARNNALSIYSCSGEDSINLRPRLPLVRRRRRLCITEHNDKTIGGAAAEPTTHTSGTSALGSRSALLTLLTLRLVLLPQHYRSCLDERVTMSRPQLRLLFFSSQQRTISQSKIQSHQLDTSRERLLLLLLLVLLALLEIMQLVALRGTTSRPIGLV